MGKLIEVPTRIFLAGLMTLVSLVGVHIYESNQYKYVPATVLAKEASPSVVIIECSYKIGDRTTTGFTSGFVASDRGYIMTVAHGLTECATPLKQKNIVVRFWNNPDKKYKAAIVRMDIKQDAAILQVPLAPREIKPLEVDFSFQVPGTRTILIGHPLLLYWSVSEGIVSADRLVGKEQRHLIQSTAATNHGNSGGPLINEDGYVIGVASFGIIGTEGLAFFVPMDTFARLAKGLYF